MHSKFIARVQAHIFHSSFPTLQFSRKYKKYMSVYYFEFSYPGFCHSQDKRVGIKRVFLLFPSLVTRVSLLFEFSKILLYKSPILRGARPPRPPWSEAPVPYIKLGRSSGGVYFWKISGVYALFLSFIAFLCINWWCMSQWAKFGTSKIFIVPTV